MKILIVKRDETDLFRIHNHQMFEVLMSNQSSSNYLRTIYELFTNYLRTILCFSCYSAGQMVYENKYRSWFTVKHYGITF